MCRVCPDFSHHPLLSPSPAVGQGLHKGCPGGAWRDGRQKCSYTCVRENFAPVTGAGLILPGANPLATEQAQPGRAPPPHLELRDWGWGGRDRVETAQAAPRTVSWLGIYKAATKPLGIKLELSKLLPFSLLPACLWPSPESSGRNQFAIVTVALQAEVSWRKAQLGLWKSRRGVLG